MHTGMATTLTMERNSFILDKMWNKIAIQPISTFIRSPVHLEAVLQVVTRVHLWIEKKILTPSPKESTFTVTVAVLGDNPKENSCSDIPSLHSLTLTIRGVHINSGSWIYAIKMVSCSWSFEGKYDFADLRTVAGLIWASPAIIRQFLRLLPLYMKTLQVSSQNGISLTSCRI